MSDGLRKKTVTEYPHLCAHCGHEFWRFVEEPLSRRASTKCPKCSREAYTLGFQGVHMLLKHLVLENVRLKSQIFDLECEAEERAEPGVRTA